MLALKNAFKLRWVPVLALPFLAHCASAPMPGTGPLGSRQLWAEYVRDPDRHPNIPNNSYAGYHAGETLSGDPGAYPQFNVKKFGARGDGSTDDTMSFQNAIAAAEADPAGGVVFAPEGRYRLTGRLVIGKSHVVLAGEGPGKTVLSFENPLSKIEKEELKSPSQYAWSGGLIHLGVRGTSLQGWGAGDAGVAVAKNADRGDTRVTLGSKLRVKAGDWVFFLWGRSFDPIVLNEIAGFEKEANYPWPEKGKRWLRRRLPWPVRIKEVHGKEIVLAQPLRLSISTAQGVTVQKMDQFVSESGVEGLSIEMQSDAEIPHLQEPGFNAIFVHRAVQSWVRDVQISGADNGVLLSAAKNITVSKVNLVGNRRMHHGFFSKDTHDCLFTDFKFETATIHGINADVFGSGNVWRRGVLSKGTFDTHHGLQFDLIRTDLDVRNEGMAGGDEDDGPQQGRRVVHWNIRLQGPPTNVNEPDLVPKGALVGIQGVPPAKASSNGAIVLDANRVPDPRDLYEAEVDLRLNQTEERH